MPQLLLAPDISRLHCLEVIGQFLRNGLVATHRLRYALPHGGVVLDAHHYAFFQGPE
jgi:hypothetical protein